MQKPHEKTPIRREMTPFPKVWKTVFFRKIANGGPRKKFSKMADFLGRVRKAKEVGNTSRTIA